jgi:membrane peptidoglycan carboxypeptidase
MNSGSVAFTGIVSIRNPAHFPDTEIKAPKLLAKDDESISFHKGCQALYQDAADEMEWIVNYNNLFKGPIPIRQALAESSNAVAVWITREIGLDDVIRTAREFGIRSPLQPYITTALGASEVRLLELAGVYRAMASGSLAEPHIIDRV